MIVPVRCFTCGIVVGSAFEAYKQAMADGQDGREALDGTGLVRFCCRRMILTHTDLIKESALYE